MTSTFNSTWPADAVAHYDESGLHLELVDGQHFRFADLPVYQQLCGLHLKEMDFAWVDGGKLFLLEVRSYAALAATLGESDIVPVKNQPAPFRFQALVDKVSDSLLMLLAAWAGTERGRAISDVLPDSVRKRLPMKLIIAVDLPERLSVHLQSLRDSLNERLRGRMALVDAPSLVLLDYKRLTTNPMFSAFIKVLV